MALTHLISYNEDFKSFFKERIPKKKDFRTISGHAPFSKEYSAQAPYTLENKYNASIVGTAFDYLARWIIARTISENKEQACSDLVAELGISKCRIEANRLNIDLEDEYDVQLRKCRQYIYGTGNIEELIEVSVFFAKLEQVYRRQLMPFDIDMNHIFSVEDEIISDLKNLVSVFQKIISDTSLVNENSIVVFNPSFGGASYICDGADADIYIDGVLYDFKCTNKNGYTWNDVAQIYGYFLLSNVARIHNDTSSMLYDYDIHRIAFYRARYGEIEYFDIISDNHKTAIDDFMEMLDEENYSRYFELQQQWEAEEKQKALEHENLIDCYNRAKAYFGSTGYFEFVDGKLTENPDETTRINLIRFALSYFANERIKDTLSSKKLKLQMDARSITVTDLARTLDLSPTTIRNWLNEKNNPNALALIKMTQIFGCTIADLIKRKRTSAITQSTSNNDQNKKSKKSSKHKIKKKKLKRHH